MECPVKTNDGAPVRSIYRLLEVLRVNVRDTFGRGLRSATVHGNTAERLGAGVRDLGVVHKLLDLLACPVVSRNTGCGCVVRSS